MANDNKAKSFNYHHNWNLFVEATRITQFKDDTFGLAPRLLKRDLVSYRKPYG